MTVGLATTDYVHKVLNHMHRAVASTAPAANYIKLHVSDPGAAGAGGASSVTTRMAATFNAASAGAVTLTAPITWTNWAGTNGEVVSHLSNWDASTSGTFLNSWALSVSKTLNTGDSLSVNTLSVSLAPLAA